MTLKFDGRYRTRDGSIIECISAASFDWSTFRIVANDGTKSLKYGVISDCGVAYLTPGLGSFFVLKYATPAPELDPMEMINPKTVY